MQQDEQLTEVLNETVTQQTVENREVTMLRVENENLFANAAIRPRNFQRIKQALLDQLEAFPELAEDSIFVKPVGGGKSVSGLGIRAAESLAEMYGHCRISSSVDVVDEDNVRITASFTDFANGRVWNDSGLLSRWYRGTDGKMKRYAEDRFINVVSKAECSKRIREVILRSISPALKAHYEHLCREKLTKILDPDKIQKILDGFKQLGVTELQVESFVGRSRSLGWVDEDRLKLAGLYSAIRSGETTVGEAFGKVQGLPVQETSCQPGLLAGKVVE